MDDKPCWTILMRYGFLKLKTNIITLMNQYTQIDGVHPKITHFKCILACTFLKIPITHTQSMFLLCKLFSMAIDEWKLMFLCPHWLGHYIMYFCSTLISFVTSQLSYILWIAVLATYQSYIVHTLLEINCNQRIGTPKNLFKMCDFWMYSVNLGLLIHQGD